MILLIAGVVIVLAVLVALRERTHARRLRELTEELQRERERTEQLTAAEERARVAREAYELARSGGAREGAGQGVAPCAPTRPQRPAGPAQPPGPRRARPGAGPAGAVHPRGTPAAPA